MAGDIDISKLSGKVAELAPQYDKNSDGKIDREEYVFFEQALSEANCLDDFQSQIGAQNTHQDDEQSEQSPITFQDSIKNSKRITVDETTSSQRLSKSAVWKTNIAVAKNTKYSENNMPTKISIQLPDSYGVKGPDGKLQRRFQTLMLVDAEKNIYSDRAGIRQFQMVVTEDGIRLTQVNTDNDKVKTYLDKQTRSVQRSAQEAVKGLQVTDGKKVMDLLSSRNTSWEAYNQIGIENRYNFPRAEFDPGQDKTRVVINTPDGPKSSNPVVPSKEGGYKTTGPFQALVSQTGYNTYEKIMPAIEGLLARVPENKKNTSEYLQAKYLHDQFSGKKGMVLDNDAARLDSAMIALGKSLHFIQGANEVRNMQTTSANGQMVMSAQESSSGRLGTAKFKYKGNKTFTLAAGDRNYSYSELTGGGANGLISNDIVANNRHGEIVFDSKKARQIKNLQFVDEKGNKYPVKYTKEGIACIQINGKYYKVQSFLNGRTPAMK